MNGGWELTKPFSHSLRSCDHTKNSKTTTIDGEM